MTSVTARVGGVRVFAKSWSEFSSDDESQEALVVRTRSKTKPAIPATTTATTTITTTSTSKTDSLTVPAVATDYPVNRSPSLTSIVAAIANDQSLAATDAITFQNTKKKPPPSWSELTKASNIETVTNAIVSYRTVEHIVMDDTMACLSTGDETLQVPPPLSTTRTSTASLGAFDPELDCSRDGLPLLLKHTKMESSLQSVKEQKMVPIPSDSVTAVSVAVRSSSFIGQKRKDADSDGSKPSISGSGGEVVHIPTVVKKQKTSKAGTFSRIRHTKEEAAIAPTPATKLNANAEPFVPITTSTSEATANEAVSEPVAIDEMSDACAEVVSLSTTTELAPAATRRVIVVVKRAQPASSSPTGAAAEPEDPAVKAHRLIQRQKQIDLGKRTVGYQRYVTMKSKRERTVDDPRTPNIHKVCSKRSWDGQVKKWRRQLHLFDDEDTIRQRQERLAQQAADTRSGSDSGSSSDNESDNQLPSLPRGDSNPPSEAMAEHDKLAAEDSMLDEENSAMPPMD